MTGPVEPQTESMVFEHLTDEANKLMADACSLARQIDAKHVGTEHLLVAALRVADRERRRLAAEGFDLTTVETALQARSTGTPSQLHMAFNSDAKEALENAWARGRGSKLRAVRVQDIWHACLAKPGSGARAMLADLGVRVEVLHWEGTKSTDL